MVRIVNATRGRELGSSVELADSFWPRLRGLLGKSELDSGGGLLIDPCRAVHMYGMRFPLDVAFLDHGGEVVALYRELAPGTRTNWHKPARQALELPAGSLAATGTVVGDKVTIETPQEETR